MHFPKISVVMPSLNQGKFIARSIHSVLDQNYPALELIVVDGGSADNTVEVLQSCRENVRWISEKDNGQTDAINKGLRMAGGEILAFLNADDLLLPNALNIVAGRFQNHPERLWLTGRCKIVDEQGGEIRSMITRYKNILLSFGSRAMLHVTNYISQPATFWRRAAVDEFGYFDETLHFVMDYEYWLRLWQTHPPLILPQYLAAFRIQSQSKTTSSGHSAAYINEERLVLRRYSRSSLLLAGHDMHRFLMTTAYRVINRKK